MDYDIKNKEQKYCRVIFKEQFTLVKLETLIRQLWKRIQYSSLVNVPLKTMCNALN